jgi:phage-related baseplate assembly protein
MTDALEPDFISRDPAQIEREVFELWEQLGGHPLQPSDPEHLFLSAFAYREALLRMAVQEAAKLNLLRFSRFPVVDFLGELMGPNADRLPARPAVTTMRFELAEPRASATLVPSGTRRRSRDGRVEFATDADAIIPAGDTHVDVGATAQTLGSVGNGYVPGQVDVEVDEVPHIVAASNTSTTAGGAPMETTEAYVDRLLLAPDAFSTAGPAAAYAFHARSASAAVRDVAVLHPAPGVVRIVVLAQNGIPDEALLEHIEEVLTHDPLRPITDTVEAVAAEEVAWELVARLVLYRDADAQAVGAAATAAAQAYADAKESQLGRDLVPSQIKAALHLPGVYEVVVDEPPRTTIEPHQWPRCTSVTVTVDSVVDEDGGAGA